MAVVRAMWLHYSATEERVSKLSDLISARSLMEPANAPGVADMLDSIEQTAPPVVGKMLRDLKEGAWGPLNSNVTREVRQIQLNYLDCLPSLAT